MLIKRILGTTFGTTLIFFLKVEKFQLLIPNVYMLAEPNHQYKKITQQYLKKNFSFNVYRTALEILKIEVSKIH